MTMFIECEGRLINVDNIAHAELQEQGYQALLTINLIRSERAAPCFRDDAARKIWKVLQQLDSTIRVT